MLPSGGRGWLALWLHSPYQTDNGCLLFGKLFGKHKCFPHLSPNKTWEGVAGGYVFHACSILLLKQMGGIWYLPVLTNTDVVLVTALVRTS